MGAIGINEPHEEGEKPGVCLIHYFTEGGRGDLHSWDDKS